MQNGSCLEEFSGSFSCTDMMFKDMIDITMVQKITEFTLTEVKKHHSGKIASNKYYQTVIIYQTVMSLVAEIK